MEKHMVTKHKFNKIVSCEYCKPHCTFKNDMKDHREIHKLEQNELQKSQENRIKSIEEQMAAFEEEKQNDIQSHKDIEKLLKECEEDMRDDTEDHTSGIPADLQINLGARTWAGGRNYQYSRTFWRKYADVPHKVKYWKKFVLIIVASVLIGSR